MSGKRHSQSVVAVRQLLCLLLRMRDELTLSFPVSAAIFPHEVESRPITSQPTRRPSIAIHRSAELSAFWSHAMPWTVGMSSGIGHFCPNSDALARRSTGLKRQNGLGELINLPISLLHGGAIIDRYMHHSYHSPRQQRICESTPHVLCHARNQSGSNVSMSFSQGYRTRLRSTYARWVRSRAVQGSMR